MPDKQIIEKTTIKEIHDTPVVVDLSPLEVKLDAILQSILVLESDVENLKEQAVPEATDETNDPTQAILALLTAIAEEVGTTTVIKDDKDEQDPILSAILAHLEEAKGVPPKTDTTSISIEAMREIMLEMISKQNTILNNTNSIKEIL